MLGSSPCPVSQAIIVDNKGSFFLESSVPSLYTYPLKAANLKALQAIHGGENTADTQNRAKIAAPIVRNGGKKTQEGSDLRCMYPLAVPSLLQQQEGLQATQSSPYTSSSEGQATQHKAIIDGDSIKGFGLHGSLQQEHLQGKQSSSSTSPSFGIKPAETRDEANKHAPMARKAGKNNQEGDGDDANSTESAQSCSSTSSFGIKPSETQDRTNKRASMVREEGENNQEGDGDDANRTESGLYGMSTMEATSILQQESLQADDPPSCTSERSMDIHSGANTQAPIMTGANEKIREDDGDVSNTKDSGLHGTSTLESNYFSQQEDLHVNDPSLCTSLSEDKAVTTQNRGSKQGCNIIDAGEKNRVDDGVIKDSGVDGMTTFLQQEDLDVNGPSSCTSLTEDKAMETQSKGSKQGCDIMDTSKKNRADDGSIKDSGVDGMTSLQQEGLLTRNPSHTVSSEKRASESQFRDNKPASIVRNAGEKDQEDAGGVVRILDEGLTSLRYLSIKELRQQLTYLLRQQDIDLRQVFLIHAIVIECGFEQNSFLSNILMSMYRRVGSMDDTALIFNKILHPSVVSWNTVISSLSENKLTNQAFRLYLEMRKQGIEPSQVTLIIALSACTDLAEGKAIHAYIRDHVKEPRTKLLNALINMYGKCGDVEEARAVFDNMPVHDVVSWNSVLAAYSENIDGKRSKEKEPIELFWHMQRKGFQPDVVTLIAALGSCANAALRQDGILIHAYIVDHGFESSVVVGNALISMYGKCRALDDTFVIFARVPKKTEVSWNALITACSELTQAGKAFQVYQEMIKQGVTPNDITFLGLLGACAHPDALALGKAIHKEILFTIFASLTYMNNALINMYGKSGALEDAHSVFDNMREQNLVSWSTLIAAYSENGKGEEALELFRKMQHTNIQPNEIVFLNLLTACCHAELLKEGTFFFTTMVDVYRITPTLKHYNCMVDLLGRVGQLAQAEDMIYQMPCPPDSQIWMALLAACRLHKDAKRANRVAKHVLSLSPQNVPTH